MVARELRDRSRSHDTVLGFLSLAPLAQLARNNWTLRRRRIEKYVTRLIGNFAASPIPDLSPRSAMAPGTTLKELQCPKGPKGAPHNSLG